MHHRRKRLLDGFTVFLAAVAVTLTWLAVYPVDAASGGRFAGGRHGGARTGGMAAQSPHMTSSALAFHPGFGVGSHGGFSRQFHPGVARAAIRPSFRAPSHSFHRFHRRSFFFFNPGGFVYPPYYYYPPAAYYPPYPPYPTPYDPGYAGVDASYPYPDPAAAYPQMDQGNVQVYTAPPEPTPAPPRQPLAPAQENPTLPLPPDDGSLHYEVSPGEAKIFLDDRYVGEARELKNIAEITAPAGRHLLEIRLGRDRTFMEVRVSPRKVTPVRLALASPTVAPEASMPEQGRLHLQVAPPGAAIYLDGTFSTVADPAYPHSLNLRPGAHQIQVVMPGYTEYSDTVTVPVGGEAVVSVQLSRE